jgi:signal transduction histidine kinase
LSDVSCKAVLVYVGEVEKRNLDLSLYLRDFEKPLRFLRDGSNRITWAEFVELGLRLRELAKLSDEDLIAIGKGAFKSTPLRFFMFLARLFATPMEFCKWFNKANATLFSNMLSTVKELDKKRMRIDVQLRPGDEMSSEYFLISKGAIAAMPTLLGHPEANVELIMNGHAASYEVVFADARPSFVRRLFNYLGGAQGAADEVLEAHRLLQGRFVELQDARAKLDRQAAQLRIAHSISQLVHGDLDIDRTLDAVSHALVDVAGFVGVRVAIAVDVEGHYVERRAQAGTLERGSTADVPLVSHGRVLGQLTLWPRPAGERQELLDVVLPTIAMAVDNAITHQALVAYRESLERKVTYRTAELRTASAELKTTIDRLQEAQAARDRIFANINHEIRTPLSLIKMAVHGLRAKYPELGGAARELDAIEFGNQKLLRLVDMLLLLASRLERKLVLDEGLFDLAELLSQIVSAWQAVCEPESLHLAYTGPASCAIVLDESLIERAVSNLVSNAVRFTPAGGSITVSLSLSDGEAHIRVRDTGVGLPPDFKSRIFGRFEQGGTAPLRGSQGSGLGLSLVKEVVDVHGGRIEIESPSDGGTAFELRLPRSETVAPGTPLRKSLVSREHTQNMVRDLVRAEPPTKFDIVPASASSETILVAEDDPGLRLAIGNVIGEKYRTIMARDGREALELAAKFLPDLLVTDVQMPEMDGFTLVREFQQMRTLRMPSALILTAYANLTDRLEGLSAGAVDYVIKPFDPAELLARIESQLALRRRALKAAENENLSALGTLVKGLMHELRNPANGIVHSISLLREQLPEEMQANGSPVRDLLDVAATCATQIEASCRDLLGTTGRGDPLRKMVPFGDIIDRARAIVSGSLGGVELIETTRYEGEVYCSDRLVAQVLANLIKNGTQAAGRGGWVKLASRRVGERVVVEVRDSGPGVPPELRERIFQLFFTTRDPGEGTGLGLHMSRQIILRHDGVLDVRDTPEGPAFCVELPLGRAAIRKS